jgi:sugar O-acyltransferase (sialic acid O-acetyltransferase NeuD family)
MEAKPLVILGAGGHGRQIADVVAAINAGRALPEWDLLGFLDDDLAKAGAVLNGVPVLGGLDWIAQWQEGPLYAMCGVGNTASRYMLAQRAQAAGVRFCNLVHPSAVLTPHITWGQGIVIAAGAILTNSITVGDHVHMGLATSASHDCVLEGYIKVAPGARLAGGVHVGQGCNIGMGAMVIQGVTIGEWSIVGAGAVVTRDLPPNVTAVGVPARIIKERPAGWHLEDQPQSTL